MPPSRSARKPGSSRSPPGARRSPTRCPSPATSRKVSMPTEAPPAPVLKPGPAQELSANPTYLEAIGAALDHEMERDPNVFIIGEDVGQFGGAFKVTKGFLDKYGPRRV